MSQEHDLRLLADEFLMFLQETAEYQQEEAAKQALQAVMQSALRIRRRLHLASRRFVVAVVGLSNVGKSTLLNALFEQQIAPCRNGPCTAVPVEFTTGNTLSVNVEYHGHFARRSISCRGMKELNQELEDLASDGSDGSSQSIRKITVEMRHPLLANGLTLADTPGFGAAQSGAAEGSHEKSLRDYLQGDVAQVFWVTLGEQGIGGREQKFYEGVLADTCDDIVVTGCDDWESTDKDRFRRRFSRFFKQRLPLFHFVSGVERTGLPELEHRIRKLAEPDERMAEAGRAMLQLAKNLGEWVREFRDPGGFPLTTPWRPDSWRRLLAAPTCGDFLPAIVRAMEPQQ